MRLEKVDGHLYQDMIQNVLEWILWGQNFPSLSILVGSAAFMVIGTKKRDDTSTIS